MPTFRAPAKLNLSLSVAPPEPAAAVKAGWHRIASWMVAIDLHDELSLEPVTTPGARSTIRIAFAPDAAHSSQVDWPLEKDLAFRAHGLLEAKVGRPLPVDATLVKRIPTGGGFGGGSSDAAAMLLGLNRIFELGLGTPELQELGAKLGSDIAFFIDDEPGFPRPALVTGFGEAIDRLEKIAAELVLVLPPFGCPTPAVYAAYDTYIADSEAQRASAPRPPGGKPPQPKTANESLIRSRYDKMRHSGRLKSEHLFNDLFIAAANVEPRLGSLVTALSNGTRCDAHVTGSGSGVFLVPDERKSAQILERTRRVLDRLRDDPESPLHGLQCAAVLARTV